MNNKAAEWHEAKRQILLALNLPHEFQLLGLELANGATPNAKGWIDAHAIGVRDRSPSAGINVQDGPALGFYKDFRNPGNSCYLFDFALRRKSCTFGEALKHYADQTKVKLPGDPGKRSLDSLELCGDLTVNVLLFYPEEKPGFTARALKELGGQAARWPRGLSADRTNYLIAFPMFGTSALHELAPTGWHVVSNSPKVKIRQWQGRGNEEKLLDKMTVGDYGLMNVDGLQRLVDADVVNIVEGISDLATVQGKLGPWRDEATEADPRKHIVLSAGSCSYDYKAEWMHHFTGKEIRIWPHIGDPKQEGETAALKWSHAFLPVAKAVRVAKLPPGKNGKIDVRDWLTEPIGPPGEDGTPTCRTYADLDAFAATFPVIDPGDQSAQLSPSNALLKSLGLEVIGEYEETQAVQLCCTHTGKSQIVPDVDKFTFTKLRQFVGGEVVDEHVIESKEPQPGIASMKDVKNAIADAACNKRFHGDEKFGSGVWHGMAKDELLLVKVGEIGVVKDGKITRSNIPFVGGRVLDISQSSGNWCDFDTLGRNLAEAQRDRWCQDTFEEADGLFGKWFWKQKPAPRIVASLVICSFLQSLWHWRPQVFITGSSDTGKSALIGETIPPLFGKLGLYVQKPTEAAIRQHIKHHSKVILIDEFEHDNNRQAVLELFRTSSRGGKTIRGTADQRGLTFQLRHIPWFAGIETGQRRQPDKNRGIILDLDEIPAGVRGKIDIPTDDWLNELGQRLLAVGLRHFWRARQLAAELKRMQVEGAPGRAVETYSVPCAMFSAIFGHPTHEAIANMQFWMQAWDFTDQATRDEDNLLQEILMAEVFTDGGRRTTVSRLLDERMDTDATSTLERVGIRIAYKRNGAKVVFFVPDTISDRLLKGSRFHGHAIEQYLGRLAGASRGQQRMGTINPRGIEVPITTIEQIFSIKGDSVQKDG